MRLRASVVMGTLLATLAILPAVAGATPTSGTLTGVNGEGTYNDTLPCGVGDGPNWRYFWLDQAASSPGGLLLGTWDGTFEVHDAGGGKAFIPNGDGRLSVTVGRGGTGFFDNRGNGSCSNATLDLTTQLDGDPFVTGVVPIIGTGGTGAFRGLTGSGTANLQLELGAGADNVARADLTGDFDVLDPVLSVGGASSRWFNTSEFLAKKLRVYVNVNNAVGVGNAYETRITSVTGGTGSFSGLPTSTLTIPAGGSGTFGFTMNNTAPNKSYTINVTIGAKDGLLAPVPPVSGYASFKSPLLP